MPLKRFRRQKNGPWYIRGTVAGQRVYESTGTCNASQAEALRIRRETELLERKTLGRAAALTFAEAALSYIEAGGEARFLTPLLDHFGPDTLLADVDNAAANRAADTIYPDRAASTINRQVITPLSAIINMAADEGLTPPRRLRRRKGAGIRTRWLTPTEAERLIDAAAPHIKPAIGFMLGAGCRSSEALTITAETFHPDTGEAFLAETKNGHPRMVRLPQRALDLVHSREIPDTGPICRTPKGKPYTMRENGGGQIAGAFNQAVKAAGLGPDVTPHVLRHTWATWYYSQTLDFGGLLDLGGWQKADMAQRYRKIAPASLPQDLFAHGWDFTPPTQSRASRIRLRVVR